MLTGNTILYGGGPQRIADTCGLSLAEGKTIFNGFWSQYPNVTRLVKQCERAAKTKGFVRLWDGHRRHFNHEWEYHKAFNSLIQGGAARIVQRAMLKFYGITDRSYMMIYQIMTRSDSAQSSAGT